MTAVRFHHVLDDRETEPGPPLIARATRVGTVEPLEYARQMLSGDAAAIVMHDHGDALALPAGEARDLSAGWDVAE